MTGALAEHTTRLGVVCAAMIASVVVYGTIVYLVPPLTSVPIAQATTLLWLFAIAALLNTVTLTPVYRAMLAGPKRVFTVSPEERPLLAAHLVASVILFARLEAVAVLGLLLFFLTGHRDWFWAFAAVAVVGMLALWPTRRRVAATLGLGTTP